MNSNYGHCPSCDKIMTKSDDDLRFKESGRRVGLCGRCADDLDIPIVRGTNVPDAEEYEEYPEPNPVEEEQFDDDVINERFGQDA